MLHYTKLKRLSSDKHSGLSRASVSHKENEVLWMWPLYCNIMWDNLSFYNNQMLLQFYKYDKLDNTVNSLLFFLRKIFCLPFQSCPLLVIVRSQQRVLLHCWKSCGLYYKHVMIVNYASSSINKLRASLIDDSRVVIYDRHMFKEQATALWVTK